MSLEIGEHIVVCVVVDLGAPSFLPHLNGFWDSACHVIKLVAFELNPIVPLSPVIRGEELGDVVVGVRGRRGLVRENAIVVKRFEDLRETLRVGTGCCR